MIITFPVAPVPKERARRARNGRFYTPPKTKHFEEDIRRICHFEMSYQMQERFEGPLKVSVVFYLNKPKSVKRKFPCVKPDLDNLQKSLLDGMNGIVFIDDAQIIDVEAKKRYAKKTPSIYIEIEKLYEV